MKHNKIMYEEPMMDIIYLESGDVVTWSNQTGTLGDNNTNVDSDDFSNLGF